MVSPVRFYVHRFSEPHTTSLSDYEQQSWRNSRKMEPGNEYVVVQLLMSCFALLWHNFDLVFTLLISHKEHSPNINPKGIIIVADV